MSLWQAVQTSTFGFRVSPVRTVGSAACAAAAPWHDSHCTLAFTNFPSFSIFPPVPVVWQPMQSFC